MSVLIASAVIGFDRYRAGRLSEVRAALDESRRLTGELAEQRTQLSEANRALELEYAVTRILAETATAAEALPQLLRTICEHTGWEAGAIWHVDSNTRVLHREGAWCAPPTASSSVEALAREQVLQPGEGLPGQVLVRGQPGWIGNPAAFGFPLLLGGDVVGVLEFAGREQREPDARQIDMMSMIGGDIAQFMEGRRAAEALRRSREERLAELERVRQRIATDLHDDIGSSLTQISILSEVAQVRAGGIDLTASEPLSMIAGSSRELVDAMSDIVWAINPQKDHLYDLTRRMRRFAADSFTALDIRFELAAG